MTKLITDFPDYTITPEGVITKITNNLVLSTWTGANGYKHVDLRKDGKGTKIALHRLLATTFIPNPDSKRVVNHIDGNKLNNSLSNLEWCSDSENIKHAYDTGLQPYKRKYSLEEYESFLEEILSGSSLTDLANRVDQGLTQLSYHIREAAERLSKLEAYEAELNRQKIERNKNTGKAQRKIINLQMLDKTTAKVIRTFQSVSEAKEFLNKKSCGPISNVLAGRQNTAYGYKWKKV